MDFKDRKLFHVVQKCSQWNLTQKFVHAKRSQYRTFNCTSHRKAIKLKVNEMFRFLSLSLETVSDIRKMGNFCQVPFAILRTLFLLWSVMESRCRLLDVRPSVGPRYITGLCDLISCHQVGCIMKKVITTSQEPKLGLMIGLRVSSLWWVRLHLLISFILLIQQFECN